MRKMILTLLTKMIVTISPPAAACTLASDHPWNLSEATFIRNSEWIVEGLILARKHERHQTFFEVKVLNSLKGNPPSILKIGPFENGKKRITGIQLSKSCTPIADFPIGNAYIITSKIENPFAIQDATAKNLRRIKDLLK